MVILLMAGIMLFPSCSAGAQLEASPSPTPSAEIPISCSPGTGSIDLIYPSPFSELIGGQQLRVTLFVSDRDGAPLGGINPRVEIWSPSHELYADLECIHRGGGRCLTDPFSLPIQDGAGTWSILAWAEFKDGSILNIAGPFQVLRSFSEGLEEQYGFWLDTTSPLFAYAGPPFADPGLKFHPYDEGGYVILSNSRVSGGVEEFVMLDVHWRPAEYPEDGETALTYVQELAGPHGMTVAYLDLEAEPARFQDGKAWRIKGYWEEPIITGVNRLGETSYPVEWLIFPCPGSDFSWTILITARNPRDLPGLREMMGTFQCPVVQ